MQGSNCPGKYLSENTVDDVVAGMIVGLLTDLRPHLSEGEVERLLQRTTENIFEIFKSFNFDKAVKTLDQVKDNLNSTAYPWLARIHLVDFCSRAGCDFYIIAPMSPNEQHRLMTLTRAVTQLTGRPSVVTEQYPQAGCRPATSRATNGCLANSPVSAA